MKKIFITIIILTVLMALVGSIFIAIGVKETAKSIRLTTTEIATNSIKGNINKTYEINSGIKEIHIEANAIQFHVVKSSGVKNIKIEIKNFINEEHIYFNANGNILTVKSLNIPIGGLKQIVLKPIVVMTIPNNNEFDIFEINSRASDTFINNIKAGKLIVRNDAGKLVLNTAIADSLDINNNAGKVDITLTTDTKEINVENNIGEVHVNALNVDKYNYNIKNKMGKVKVGHNEYSGIQNEIITSKGDINISIDNNVGSVSVR